MGKYDDKILMKSQNAAWKGMIDYFKTNGTNKDYQGHADHWGGCDVDDDRCEAYIYREAKENHEGGFFGMDKMEVYEPCNYVSNIAFYHAAQRVCDYEDFSIDVDY